MSILEAVAAQREPVGAAEVAEATGLSISTASRLMISFAEAGLLHRTSHDRRYVLGARLYGLAREASQQLDVPTIARPHLERLRDITEETATMHIMRGAQRICIAEVPGFHQVRRVVPVGHGEPLAGSATGAVLLSACHPAEQRRAIDELGLPRTERSRFEHLVEHATRTGWALVADDWVKGLCGVSALVPDGSETPTAISVSGPSVRFTSKVAAGHVATLLEAAITIADQLGGRPRA